MGGGGRGAVAERGVKNHSPRGTRGRTEEEKRLQCGGRGESGGRQELEEPDEREGKKKTELGGIRGEKGSAEKGGSGEW